MKTCLKTIVFCISLLSLLSLIQSNDIYDVIIIGAGAAGISAASELKKFNLKVKILEGRDKIGGRMRTDFDSFGYPIDLGAILITQQADNPILRLIREYKIRQVPMDFGNQQFHGETGKHLVTAKVWKQIEKIYKGFNTYLNVNYEQLKDGSVREALNSYIEKGEGLNDFDRLLLHYYGNFLNMSLKRPLWDVKKFMLEGAQSFTGDVKMTPDGYTSIVQPLADTLNIQLNTVVDSIEQFEDHAIVKDSKGNEYKTKYVINTVALGYLKQNKMKFTPALSQPIQEAIDKLAFFNMNKVFLEFEEKFWGDKDFLGFIYPPPMVFDQAANLHKVTGKNLLMFFITDDMFEYIRYKSEEEVKEMVLSVLRPSYSEDKIKITKFYQTNWNEDPFTFGSFSEVAGHVHLRKRFMKPEGRLIFAGEHTAPKFNAFVYGAYLSGRRAAHQTLDLLKIKSKGKLRK